MTMKKKSRRRRRKIIHYFEGYLAKLTDDRNAYSVVLRAIHRKVFLKRTNHAMEQKMGERREETRRAVYRRKRKKR